MFYPSPLEDRQGTTSSFFFCNFSSEQRFASLSHQNSLMLNEGAQTGFFPLSGGQLPARCRLPKKGAEGGLGVSFPAIEKMHPSPWYGVASPLRLGIFRRQLFCFRAPNWDGGLGVFSPFSSELWKEAPFPLNIDLGGLLPFIGKYLLYLLFSFSLDKLKVLPSIFFFFQKGGLPLSIIRYEKRLVTAKHFLLTRECISL